MTDLSGSCLCGAVRFQLSASPLKTGHCHCESCRRTTSSPITTFVCVSTEDVAFSGAPRSFYASSPGVSRGFCGTCGSPLSFESRDKPGQIDLYAASLREMADIKIEQHWHWHERVGWLTVADDLPKHDD